MYVLHNSNINKCILINRNSYVKFYKFETKMLNINLYFNSNKQKWQNSLRDDTRTG